MKPRQVSSLSPVKQVCAFSAILGLALIALPSPTLAQVVSLSSANSSATVDLGTSAGMNNWTVDGGNQLNQQWFWYRIGNGLATPINTIGAIAYSQPGADQLAATYSSSTLAGFSLEIKYILSGGAINSGASQILETIKVNNTTGGDLDFHLFQYSDFNLGGTAGGDSVEIFNSGSGYDFVSQSDGVTEIAEAITLPEANRAEARLYDTTRNNLDTVPGYNLDNNLTTGPGDATWSLQWDVNVLNNSSFEVFKNKALSVTPIPEPAALSLLTLGLGACRFIRRRK